MQNKETRKLQAHGNFSIDVSLPKWWVSGHGLKAGSKVRLISTPEKVIVEPLEGE